MAIVKTIQIHNSAGIAAVNEYIQDPSKTKLDIDEYGISRELAYDMNPDKTTLIGTNEILIDGYKCAPEAAETYFSVSKNRYERRHNQRQYSDKKERVATHLVQSFEAGSDPRIVHQIGMEFCEQLNEKGLGDYYAVVSTHMNTMHPHNHILLCDYSIDGHKKFADNMTTLRTMREINDELSIKYGLNVIKERSTLDQYKDVHSDENRNPYIGQTMGERVAIADGRSWKEQMRVDIEGAMKECRSYDHWKRTMQSYGYELRTYVDGRVLSISDGRHACRMSKLGPQYSYEEMVKTIAKKNNMKIPDFSVDPNYYYIYNPRVSRYSDNGRRRSDLEMMILRTINFLKRVLEKLLEEDPEKNKLEEKINGLERSLKLMQELGIENISEIKKRQKVTGKDIATVKTELETYEQSRQKIEETLKAKNYPKTLAELLPMTSKQRQALFLATKDNGFQVKRKYEYIDSITANEVIAWINSDRNSAVPAILTDQVPDETITEDLLISRLEALEELIDIAQDTLEKLNSEYKDLVYLDKNAKEARDIDDKRREDERQQRRKDKEQLNKGRER